MLGGIVLMGINLNTYLHCVCVRVCVESKCRQEYGPVNVCACQQPLSGPLLSLWGASSRLSVKKKKASTEVVS